MTCMSDQWPQFYYKIVITNFIMSDKCIDCYFAYTKSDKFVVFILLWNPVFHSLGFIEKIKIIKRLLITSCSLTMTPSKGNGHWEIYPLTGINLNPQWHWEIHPLTGINLHPQWRREEFHSSRHIDVLMGMCHLAMAFYFGIKRLTLQCSLVSEGQKLIMNRFYLLIAHDTALASRSSMGLLCGTAG